MPRTVLYNRLKIGGHVIFWLASIALMLSFFYFNEKRVHFDLVTLVKALITNIGFAVAVYVNLYFLIPRFLKEKNYIFYIFWLIILLTLSSLIIQFLLLFPLRKALNFKERFTSFDVNLHSAYFFASMIYVAVTSFLKFIKEWFSLQDLNFKLAKIEQQKLEAELKTLKGQLNPHFLFNSLNNIYSLALIKSDKVPDLILQLSDLMRHIIYESKEKYIPLEKELEFVNNFITLQKIRVPENVLIKYKIEGKVPSSKIAPLLFEPFIDNAFKHGLPGNEGEDFIEIKFNFEKESILDFFISNNFEERENWDRKNSGIGISNVKQRLKLLYHQNDYSLTTNKENQIFSVYLQLKLK
ncbi:GHKL domain-containing protein [Maribellus comscasis]|uniref:GHKL domain-containing protein n=1 Tax=Maribellus comscasis TaxID=2681766 RepID=A0A6I6JSK0_9BACT|nr:histidine kinase [Maribellus comscasis]QGY43107.1 GHKL domain-containing protein [Maribellus comscasis]